MKKHSCLMLCPIEPTHLENTRRWANDPAIQMRILRYLPVTRRQQQQWYENILTDKSKVVFALTLDGSGEHIGNAGFYHLDGVHRRGELWILIGAPDRCGQGLGTEAVRKLLAYGFSSLNLNRIFLYVDADNTAAIACYKRCGFRKEGCLREHCFIGGRYLDLWVMAILRKDGVGFSPKESE